jgi:hypothetical protein
MGNILPPDLRPRTKSLGTHMRTTSASVKTMNLGSPSRTPAKPVVQAMLPRDRLLSALGSPGKPQSTESPQRRMSPVRQQSATRTAAPSIQSSMAPPASRLARAPTSTRRPSLSAGAMPMPTSASHPKMELPKPTAQRERTRSAMHPAEIISAQRQTGLTRPRPEAAARTAAPASRPAPAAASSARSMMPPPSRTALPRAGSARTGPSALPSTSRAVPASRAAQGTMGPPTRPASFRPTSMAPPPVPAKSSLPPTASRGVAATSAARPGLTRPSASTTVTRAFGGEAAQTNRLVRPTASATGGLPKPSTRAVPGKISMAPFSPSKRDTTALKSRAASTPAETVARSLVRPTVSKSSIPPTGTRPVSGTSALPRPGASRMPVPSTSKLSTGAAASRRGDSSQLTALKARIDAASARQAVSRRP